MDMEISVVQTLDNAIHVINLYPVDNAIDFPNTYPFEQNQARVLRINVTDTCITDGYLTITPRARMGSESIAHEAEGPMGY